MLRDQASLVHIVQFDQILKSTLIQRQKQQSNNSYQREKQKPKSKISKKIQQIYHMDEITQIFNNSTTSNSSTSAEKKQFGDRIFTDLNDVNSNILLKGEHFMNRLLYLNDLRVKNVDLSAHGDLLLTFFSGRVILILRNNGFKNYKKFIAIDLNSSLVKGKIQSAKFAMESSQSLVVLYANQKVYFYDYLMSNNNQQMLEIWSQSCGDRQVNDIHSFVIKDQNQQSSKQVQKLIVALQYPQKIAFFHFNVQKKKAILLNTYYLDSGFIQSIFIYPKVNSIYISTALSILRLDLSQLFVKAQKQIQKLPKKMSRSKSSQSHRSSKDKIQPNLLNQPNPQSLKAEVVFEFCINSPQDILYVSSNGSFFPKVSNTTKQYPAHIAQTCCGISIAITCKKQGNYKQGQLLIGIQSQNDDLFEQMIRKCIQRIKHLNKWQYINFDDLYLILMGNSKSKKEITHQLSKFLNQSMNKFLTQKQQNKHAIISEGKNELIIPSQNNNKHITATQCKQQSQQPHFIEIFNSIKMSEEQLQILAINLSYIFDLKQSVRQKLIQKRIISHFKASKHKGGSCINLQYLTKKCKQLCIFTHKQIQKQFQILECKCCDVYGIKLNNKQQKQLVNKQQKQKKQVIWQQDLRKGSRRCYICLNQMKLLL